MVCVRKKKAEVGTKALLNKYVGIVVIPEWIRKGGTGVTLSEATGVKKSAISGAKTKRSGLDLDSLEKIAIGTGRTFLGLLREAIAWQETPENSRYARIALRKPNRARAEAAFERLGNSPEKVRVWAEAVYAGLRATEDPDPETLIQRIILEKKRDPEATGLPRLKCPGEWNDWESVRNAFLKREELHHLWGPMVFFSKTPTATERPDRLSVETLRPLVEEFCAEHPPTDDRWSELHDEYAKEARVIERTLHLKQPVLKPPKTNKKEPSEKEDEELATVTPITGGPPHPKK
jgi:hypothetical protein